ncbi:hypothetical protein GRI97_11450 [Altererythrobacter xixiisoli]|uniref:Uncharacterized protein n=1 Tax=Croceibacterium xixiisoli TaxID=1476466 RepID=A0A6I4TZ02_9SPHN|nr:hypothetical protein [Croceibacterium xixiisoli]
MARDGAIVYLRATGRDDLAALVAAGEGDDFPEVRSAAAALRGLGDVLTRYEAALRQYAEADFWDDDWPGGALARHDHGEMARNVLNGRPPFFHRD